MKHIWFFLILMLCASISSSAQKSKGNAVQQKQTTQTKKSAAKPSASTKKNSASPTATNKKTNQKTLTQREKLQAEQQQLKKDIAAKKKQKEELDKKVKQQLQDVFILGSAIDDKQRVLDTIKTDIAILDSNLLILNARLDTLQQQLKERQQRYAQSVRYMHRNNSMRSRALFIFSAKNVNQMYRRTRFMNEYATYQKAQGEAVQQKQEEVAAMLEDIEQKMSQKRTLLARGEKERKSLESRQAEQQAIAKQLQKEQQAVQTLIQKQQKEEAELNARIDKLIAEEIAREKARIEAEKRKAEEQARKERERQKRLAEAKAREEKAKAEAKAAKTQQEKAAAKKRAQNATQQRKAAERDVEESRKKGTVSTVYANADTDQKLTGSFASNKGRLPMPITGNYQIVRNFGANVVDGAGNGVHLSSKGIYLKGQPGAQARCVFDGTVSRIFANGNTYIVMVRHGKYITVYCDLASVSVTAGQHVTTNQKLGSLGPSCLMQFQLRNWINLLNPRQWLRR